MAAPEQGRATSPRPAPSRPAPPAGRGAPPAPKDPFFVSTLPPAEILNKQAVVETSMGELVIDLLADAAPNHVAHFITRAREGAYDGTTFHRVIALGIIQGGDPLSKDPAQAAKYGTGGLGVLRFEENAEKHTKGSVSAVLVPGRRDSGGSQFFITVTDQPTLDGQYTVFGRLADGLGVAQKISQVAADNTVPRERVEIRRVTIRERPAPIPEPFVDASVEDMARRRVVLETTLGPITIEVFPDRAPNPVRQFLRLAAGGVYDGTAFHRIAKGFVIQGGHMPTRREPPNERQEGYIRTLQPEFSQTTHVRGIVSMARGEDPASATSSFFIVLGPAPALDGRYSVFGRVVAGLDTIEKIEAQPVDGETPVTRIEVTRARVEP
jgi:peptidyl-prolyl cis-trans isomerase B (cyclophilin B)